MKKSTIYVIIGICCALFATASWYGITHSRGTPVDIKAPKKPVLKVAFLNQSADLKKGVFQDVWDNIKPKTLEMMHQVTVLPWASKLVKSIDVRTFFSASDRNWYFCLEWKDDTENRKSEFSEFTDACAVMFFLGNDSKTSTIMMGFNGKATVWHWKASRDQAIWAKDTIKPRRTYSDFYYPFEEEELFPVSKIVHKSAVQNLASEKIGTLTPKKMQNVHGRGIWKDGVWRVVFKAAPGGMTEDIAASAKSGHELFFAFAVWNGAAKDRGGRKSISELVKIKMKRDQ